MSHSRIPCVQNNSRYLYESRPQDHETDYCHDVHFGLKCGYVKLNPNPSLFYESCMIKQKYNLMRKLSIYRAETREILWNHICPSIKIVMRLHIDFGSISCCKQARDYWISWQKALVAGFCVLCILQALSSLSNGPSGLSAKRIWPKCVYVVICTAQHIRSDVKILTGG